MFVRHYARLLGSVLVLVCVLVVVQAVVPAARISALRAVAAPRSTIASVPATTSGSPNNACPPAQSLNANSNDANWVKVIQYRLNYAVYPTGFPYFKTHPWLATDGSFGTKTYDAVVAYQTWEGISGGNGVVGDRTWASLGFCQSTVVNAFTSFSFGWGSNFMCPPRQVENGTENTPEFVEAVQDLLNQAYFNHPALYATTSPKTWYPYLQSDGSFGSQTYAAVYDYQSSIVLSSSGDVGPYTWANLGMCYYTSVG